MAEKICGECRYHRSDNEKGFAYVGWYCNNEDSDYYTDYTEYSDSCEDWEGRE